MDFPYDNNSDNIFNTGGHGENIIAEMQRAESEILSFINSNSWYFENNYSQPLQPLINPYCFNKGTYILCLSPQFKDVWVRVENLTQNTLVKTYKHLLKPIMFLLGKNKNPIKTY
jgi:hypothetical protein